MAIVDQIQSSSGETRDIGAKSQNVAYTNQSAPSVSNTKQALDELFANGGGSGGGGSTTIADVPYFKNPSIPRWKDNLKVLFIGNSYTMYGTQYITNILNELDVAADNVTIRLAHASARTLSTWLSLMLTDGAITQLHYWSKSSGEWKRAYNSPGGGIRTQVSGTPWDVIVFQVYPQTANSGEAANNYQSFKSTIKEFIYECRKACPNKQVAFGFNMIWAKDQSRSANTSTWASIVKATKDLVADSGLDIIIPSGTAFMNAVNTNTYKGEDHSFLMSDGTGHPAQGVARYVAACTIWEVIFASIYGSMYGLNQAPTYTADGNALAGAEIPVTQENIRLCQQVALAAISDMWTANTTIDPIV